MGSAKNNPKFKSAECPTVGQLLDVIREYNRAHELDLAEHQAGAVDANIRNEFLEDLYFAAAGAAKALRPAMQVELKISPIEKSAENAKTV